MAAPVAIEVDGLSKSFGPVRAVDAVSLRINPGEIYGFLGLNGAGKTTTIRALLGMIRPDAGRVRLLGSAVGPYGRGPWQRVGYLVGQPAACPDLTVWENLEVARRLYGIGDRGAVARVIDLLRLGEYRERRAGALSTGNRQRLGLARALLHDPALLILDEPGSGLDPAGVVEIRDLLADLARSRGVTVFMSSHILTEVDRLADRIGIIHGGRLIEELAPERLRHFRSRRLLVAARDLVAARSALEEAGFAVETDGGRLALREARAINAPDEVAALLVRAGAPPTLLLVEQESLEAHFLRVTEQQP